MGVRQAMLDVLGLRGSHFSMTLDAEWVGVVSASAEPSDLSDGSQTGDAAGGSSNGAGATTPEVKLVGSGSRLSGLVGSHKGRVRVAVRFEPDGGRVARETLAFKRGSGR